MTEQELEAFSKLLVDLFLESPRRRKPLNQPNDIDSTYKEAPDCAKGTMKQSTGDQKNGRQPKETEKKIHIRRTI